MNKTDRQIISINKWREANGRGTLNLIRRFGKTRILDNIIKNIINQRGDIPILILTPNDITKKNIEQNVTFGKNTIIMTSNQFINYIKDKQIYPTPILFVLEEAHKFLKGDIYDYIKNIKSKFTLGLTGSTLDKYDISKLNLINMPIIDYISEVEAISENWISNYIEYNLPVELTESDKIKYATYSELISSVLSNFKGIYKPINIMFQNNIFKSDFDLIMACFIGHYYKGKNGINTFIKPDILRNIVADCQGWKKDLDLTIEFNKNRDIYWNPDNIYETAKLFKNYVKKRNDILIYNRPKIDKVIEIINKFNTSTICFNESIQMVDDLNNIFSKTSVAYHSAIESRYVWDIDLNDYIRFKNGDLKKIGKTGLKKLAIEGMRTGKYKQLFTAKSLNEGLTIENIELVITTGGSTNPQTHEQRVSRGKTIDYLNPSKVCIIINLYIDDFNLYIKSSNLEDMILKEVKSRDKQKLILRQITNEIQPIWITNLDMINNNE